MTVKQQPKEQHANCDRCRRLLRVATKRRENSRPFRRSLVPKGLCPECVVTEFLYNTYPVNMIIDQAGPELLLKGGGRLAAQALTMSGLMDQCEMSVEEINWQRIVDNWNLPVKVKRSGLNPYRMGEAKRQDTYSAPDRPPLFDRRGDLVVRRDPATGEITANGKPLREAESPETADAIEGLMRELRKRERAQ